ncbi:MAG: DNA translocase FtsK [Anaerolineae bacterium]|nr:DNA translocase FtsK [Anaerolineae bacterium]
MFLGYSAILGTCQIAEEWWTGLNGWLLASHSLGGGLVGFYILDFLRYFGDIGAIVALFIGYILAVALISTKSVAILIWNIKQALSGPRVVGDANHDTRKVITSGNIGDPNLPPIHDRRPGQGGQPPDRVIVPRYDPVTGERLDDDDDLIINNPPPRQQTRRFVEDDDPNMAQVPVMPAPPPAEPRPAPQRLPPQPKASGATQVSSANTKGLPPARVIGGDSSPRPAAAANAAPASAPQRSAPTGKAPSQNTTEIRQPNPVTAPPREWVLPDIEKVLDVGKDVTLSETDIRARAKLIEDTLSSFGVPAKVVEINRGPTITQYGVEPGFVEMKNGKQMKVKVGRIAGLADDLALALAAPRIRVQAPVPGTSYVGIEVPNGETALVSLRDVMESDEYGRLKQKTRLALGLGQDVSGHAVIADLTTMPHLLIAGTTGSGKSVCVNAIIVALLINNSPEAVKLLMVDPKRVELTGYNGIPHLISPVVVDVEQVTSVLKWLVSEMERRYRIFAKHGSRNIVDFNDKAVTHERAVSSSKAPAAPSDVDTSDLKKMSYIVAVIDELADLMMLAPDETEKLIVRLAQMARATGIHLILATQRPSVDVVTGLIKANFPARIAFTVASAIDSRVILDSPGAEKLLGRGDMLVLKPDQPQPQRSQGCFLSDKEINRVVRHWRGQLVDPSHPSDTLVATQMPLPMSSVTGTAAPPPPNLNRAVPSSPSVTPSSTARQMPTASSYAPPVNDIPPWELPPQSGSKEMGETGTMVLSGGSGSGASDGLFDEAVETVKLQGKASISLLQRRLRIGYTRAARLIEDMEEKGIVGPQTPGSQFREVLVGGPPQPQPED